MRTLYARKSPTPTPPAADVGTNIWAAVDRLAVLTSRLTRRFVAVEKVQPDQEYRLRIIEERLDAIEAATTTADASRRKTGK